MEDFIKMQKKTNLVHTILLAVCAVCCVGVFVTVAYTASVLIPVVNDVSIAVEGLKNALESNLDALQTISDSIINQNVVGGLADGIQRINEIDIDTLNGAIKDLKDVVQPLAKTVNFFR